MPITFMSLTNGIFKYFLDPFVIVFIIDVFVYSKSKEECAGHLHIVLGILKAKQLYAKFYKCKLNVVYVIFRYMVFEKGVVVDP